MKLSPLALSAVVALLASSSPTCTVAFVPHRFSTKANSLLSLHRGSGATTFIGGTDDVSLGAPSGFLTAQRYFSHDMIVSRQKQKSELYGFLGQDDLEDSSSTSDEKADYKQTMSADERRDNLQVIRQINNHDLEDLQRRRDYAGWVEAKKDLRRRKAADPWFDLNHKLKEAVLLNAPESEILELQQLIQKIGGPPPGVKHARVYATAPEIYDKGMSLNRAEAIVEMEQKKLNHQKWQAMIAEREANERKEEERRANENPYLREEEEARKRREKTMKILYGKVEEERKKKEEKAREIQEKYGLDKDDLASGSGTVGGKTPLDRAIEAAKEQLEEKKKSLLGSDASLVGGGDSASTSEGSSSGSSSAESKQGSEGGGRPRIPGDVDITRGEIDESTVTIEDHSDVTTDDLVRVQVTSGYNPAQSDPPMRKHCFTYTIKITNLSPTDTIQLTSRKFEIQTVGASQKDVVSGHGVTGRQPVLKPGETFEYTSTAPLSVRPIGTTIVAARMKGAYEYNVVDVIEEGKEATGGEGAEGAEKSGPKVEIKKEGQKCELGTFHFIFPEDQRVQPVVRKGDEDEDEDDEEDDEVGPAAATSSSAASSAAKPAAPPAAATTPSLPGDEDMKTGTLTNQPTDASDTTTHNVRVAVTTEYKPERSSPPKNKYVFAYSIRITNNNPHTIKLTGRQFEIQTIGSPTKDVVRGQGVTGRYPVLKSGESFEYTSTAPLSVKPLGDTPVVARMAGRYSFVKVDGEDSATDAPPAEGEEGQVMEAELGAFHFMLPALDIA